MGSIGGNLCFADPHSDPATFLLALDAEVEARRGSGEPRRIEIADFVRGPFENALEPGELLTAVLVPEPPPGAAIVHRKFVLPRAPGDHRDLPSARGRRPARGRAARGRLGRCRRGAGVAAEEALAGASADGLDAALERAGERAADAAEPVEDANGSVEYKRHLVGVLSRRAVRAAVEAGEQPGRRRRSGLTGRGAARGRRSTP